MQPSLAQSASILALAGLLSGCVGGNPMVRNAPVKIRTNPEGALATSEYGDSCTTPCSLRLRTSRGGMIRITKEGHEDVEVFVGSHHSSTKAIGRAVGHAIDPDPTDLAIDAIFTLFDPVGQDRRLNTYSVQIDLPQVGAFAPVEVMHASADRIGKGSGVVRLKQEEVNAILGEPLSNEPPSTGDETATGG